jgi:hypothetical protein
MERAQSEPEITEVNLYRIVRDARLCHRLRSRSREAVSFRSPGRNNPVARTKPFSGTLEAKQKPTNGSVLTVEHEGAVMWDMLLGLVLVYPAVEMVEEWRRNRVAKRLLSKMREHVEQHHRWDATSGQWLT